MSNVKTEVESADEQHDASAIPTSSGGGGFAPDRPLQSRKRRGGRPHGALNRIREPLPHYDEEELAGDIATRRAKRTIIPTAKRRALEESDEDEEDFHQPLKLYKHSRFAGIFSRRQPLRGARKLMPAVVGDLEKLLSQHPGALKVVPVGASKYVSAQALDNAQSYAQDAQISLSEDSQMGPAPRKLAKREPYIEYSPMELEMIRAKMNADVDRISFTDEQLRDMDKLNCGTISRFITFPEVIQILSTQDFRTVSRIPDGPKFCAKFIISDSAAHAVVPRFMDPDDLGGLWTTALVVTRSCVYNEDSRRWTIMTKHVTGTDTITFRDQQHFNVPWLRRRFVNVSFVPKRVFVQYISATPIIPHEMRGKLVSTSLVEESTDGIETEISLVPGGGAYEEFWEQLRETVRNGGILQDPTHQAARGTADDGEQHVLPPDLDKNSPSRCFQANELDQLVDVMNGMTDYGISDEAAHGAATVFRLHAPVGAPRPEAAIPEQVVDFGDVEGALPDEPPTTSFLPLGVAIQRLLSDAVKVFPSIPAGVHRNNAYICLRDPDSIQLYWDDIGKERAGADREYWVQEIDGSIYFAPPPEEGAEMPKEDDQVFRVHLFHNNRSVASRRIIWLDVRPDRFLVEYRPPGQMTKVTVTSSRVLPDDVGKEAADKCYRETNVSIPTSRPEFMAFPTAVGMLFSDDTIMHDRIPSGLHSDGWYLVARDSSGGRPRYDDDMNWETTTGRVLFAKLSTTGRYIRTLQAVGSHKLHEVISKTARQHRRVIWADDRPDRFLVEYRQEKILYENVRSQTVAPMVASSMRPADEATASQFFTHDHSCKLLFDDAHQILDEIPTGPKNDTYYVCRRPLQINTFTALYADDMGIWEGTTRSFWMVNRDGVYITCDESRPVRSGEFRITENRFKKGNIQKRVIWIAPRPDRFLVEYRTTVNPREHTKRRQLSSKPTSGAAKFLTLTELQQLLLSDKIKISDSIPNGPKLSACFVISAESYRESVLRDDDIRGWVHYNHKTFSIGLVDGGRWVRFSRFMPGTEYMYLHEERHSIFPWLGRCFAAISVVPNRIVVHYYILDSIPRACSEEATDRHEEAYALLNSDSITGMCELWNRMCASQAEPSYGIGGDGDASSEPSPSDGGVPEMPSNDVRNVVTGYLYADEVIRILLSGNVKVFDEIPPGPKTNEHFVIAAPCFEDDISKPDDCGRWRFYRRRLRMWFQYDSLWRRYRRCDEFSQGAFEVRVLEAQNADFPAFKRRFTAVSMAPTRVLVEYVGEYAGEYNREYRQHKRNMRVPRVVIELIRSKLMAGMHVEEVYREMHDLVPDSQVIKSVLRNGKISLEEYNNIRRRQHPAIHDQVRQIRAGAFVRQIAIRPAQEASAVICYSDAQLAHLRHVVNGSFGQMDLIAHTVAKSDHCMVITLAYMNPHRDLRFDAPVLPGPAIVLFGDLRNCESTVRYWLTHLASFFHGSQAPGTVRALAGRQNALLHRAFLIGWPKCSPFASICDDLSTYLRNDSDIPEEVCEQLVHSFADVITAGELEPDLDQSVAEFLADHFNERPLCSRYVRSNLMPQIRQVYRACDRFFTNPASPVLNKKLAEDLGQLVNLTQHSLRSVLKVLRDSVVDIFVDLNEEQLPPQVYAEETELKVEGEVEEGSEMSGGEEEIAFDESGQKRTAQPAPADAASTSPRTKQFRAEQNATFNPAGDDSYAEPYEQQYNLSYEQANPPATYEEEYKETFYPATGSPERRSPSPQPEGEQEPPRPGVKTRGTAPGGGKWGSAKYRAQRPDYM